MRWVSQGLNPSYELAAASFRKSDTLDKPAFHSLVKAEYTRLEAGENV